MEMHYAEEYVDEKENNKSFYWQYGILNWWKVF